MTNEAVGKSRWRGRANGASATTYGGGEMETRAGSGGIAGRARAAKLAEPERAFHSAAGVKRSRGALVFPG